jgi:hypothetical protein
MGSPAGRVPAFYRIVGSSPGQGCSTLDTNELRQAIEATKSRAIAVLTDPLDLKA